MVPLHPLLGGRRLRRAFGPALVAPALALAACSPARPAAAPHLLAHEEGPVPGRSWLAKAGPGEGVLTGRFEGRPYALGLAVGRLTRGRIAAQEQHLLRLFTALVPNGATRLGIRQLSAFRLRSLPREIPEELLLSIAGVADGYEPEHPASGWGAYRRMLDLHALHDISQRFVDAPGLVACTGFVAGPVAARGRTLLARNFDFEGGDLFDREKLVSVFVPDGRVPYLSVGFSGMLGVMSGFNREGIGVALHAVSGGETAASGTPVTLLLADVLRNERTFAGALARLERARVFVSDLILLADGKTGEVAIVGRAPQEFAVRRPGPEGWLAAANEAGSGGLAERPLPPGSTSPRRRERAEELLRAAAGTGGLDVESAVAILRDRWGAGGADLGPGSRNAIDGLFAAHSVVFDLTARRAFVATSPHALGAYVPVDLETVLAAAGGPTAVSASPPIPADPYLLTGRYGRWLAARHLFVRTLSRKSGSRPPSEARSDLERSISLAPGFAEAEARLGEVLARGGEAKSALAHLDAALARDPAPEPLKRAIRRLREAVASGAPLPLEPLPFALQADERIALAED